MNNVPRWVFPSLAAIFVLFVWVCIGKRLHQDAAPTVTHQTGTAVVTNTARTSETNLVPSGTDTTNGISLKGKVQSGWGESK